MSKPESITAPPGWPRRRPSEALAFGPQELPELSDVGAIGRHRAPLHRPPLEVRQACRAGGLQWRRHFGADTHRDGVTHEEQAQRLSCPGPASLVTKGLSQRPQSLERFARVAVPLPVRLARAFVAAAQVSCLAHGHPAHAGGAVGAAASADAFDPRPGPRAHHLPQQLLHAHRARDRKITGLPCGAGWNLGSPSREKRPTT